MTTDTKKETKKRNQGPVNVLFGTAEKADHKRVPKGVTTVIVKSRNGQTKTFDLSAIPSEHLTALAAVAYAAKAKSYVNNHAEKDDEVIGMADKIFSDFVAGNLYTKGDAKTGGKRGRQFDATLYVLAYQKARESQSKAGVKNSKGALIKVATQQELDALKTQLVSMTAQDRSKKIKVMLENPVFKKHFLAVQAAQIKTKDVDDTVNDLEF